MPEVDFQQGHLEEITRTRLLESGIWHNIFRNFEGRKATSCRSAITIRDRLGTGGNGGVPLWVEMKSEIGVLSNRSGDKKLFYAAHTRANSNFDRRRMCEVINLDPDEFAHVNNTKKDEEFFGLVNPLNVDFILREYYDVPERDVFQIFDSSLLIEEGFPVTVTTNLGNHEYGMEIKAQDLIRCIERIFPHSSIGEFSVPEDIWLGRNLKHIDKGREDWQ